MTPEELAAIKARADSVLGPHGFPCAPCYPVWVIVGTLVARVEELEAALALDDDYDDWGWA